jgi:hypothetical protein
MVSESNIYEQNLDIKEKDVKECQENHSLDSCLKCDQIIGCTLRDEYVKAVYASMNKGETGGFEF